MPDPVPQVSIPFTGGTTDAGNPFGIPGGSVPYVEPPGQNYAPQEPQDFGDTGDYTPPPSNPPPVIEPVGPPGPPQPGPPLYTDTGLGGFFGGVGSIFGSRRYRPSKLAKELEQLGRRVGMSAIRGAANYLRSVGIGAEEVLSSSRALVPYVEQGPGYLARLGRGLIGGTALSQLVGLAFPEKLSDTDQFPLPLSVLAQGPLSRTVRGMVFQQQFKEARRVPNAEVQALLGRGPDVILGEREVGRRELIRGNLAQFVQDPELLLGVLSRGKRDVITATAPGFNDYAPLPDITVTARRVSGPTVGPRPTGMPAAPAPSTSPSSPPQGRGRLPSPGIKWGKIAIGAGAIVAANIILPRVFGSSPSSSFTVPPASRNEPGATNAPVVQPGVLPGALLAGGVYGGSGGQYCVPAPRGPRRKCLERAPVSWRAGSRKGKAAGTKCLRYASRRT